MSMDTLAVLAAVAAFYTFFYSAVVARAGALAEGPVVRSGLLERHPRREVDALAKLTLAALSQAAFALLLLAVSPVTVGDVVGGSPAGAWLVAVPLGLAELALSVLLCTATVALVADPRRMLAGGSGGWIAQFAAARRLAPHGGFLVLALGYVAAEEVVFRGVVVTLAGPWGMAVAVPLSVALYCWAQVAGMPRRADAFFPLVGASVVGVTHAVVFWFTGDVGPLAVAHLVFLVGAFTQLRARDLAVSPW